METTVESLPKETSVNKKPKASPTLTSSPQASRAKILALLGEDWDFKAPEARSFLMWLGFLPTKDPDIFYSKMLKAYLVLTVEKLSKPYLPFLPTLGTELNGKYLIQRAGSPKIEREYSLSDTERIVNALASSL